MLFPHQPPPLPGHLPAAHLCARPGRGMVRGMWGSIQPELRYQAGAWEVFRHRASSGRPADGPASSAGHHLSAEARTLVAARLLAAVLAPILVWIGGLVLGPFGGQLLLAFPFAWIASGIIYGLVFKCLLMTYSPPALIPPCAPSSLLLVFALSFPSTLASAQENPNMLTAEETGWLATPVRWRLPMGGGGSKGTAYRTAGRLSTGAIHSSQGRR
jgi:hypothetical protein